jgi:hypothetical protein
MLKEVSTREALRFSPHKVFNDPNRSLVAGMRKLPD